MPSRLPSRRRLIVTQEVMVLSAHLCSSAPRKSVCTGKTDPSRPRMCAWSPLAWMMEELFGPGVAAGQGTDKYRRCLPFRYG